MSQNILPDEMSKRFVAVLNGKIEHGKLMNALGHMTAGLVGLVQNKELFCFLEYRDKNEGVHPNISHFGFIVLRAENSNQIRQIREQAIAQKILFTDFASTMTIGTSQEQQESTSKTPEIELDYFGICLFGETEKLKSLTKKFSLFK
ncbi:DUF2000 domain-containing protein [Candidatus Parcubacteria bacterium]|nr:DUF2000 domain-containing protein [Candidatus Parcubacteria bacterium]